MSALPFFTNPLAPAIYVFESNRAGTFDHDAGQIAQAFYHADNSVREGASGEAYAIPVRDSKGKALSFTDIKWQVEAFLGYARQHKDSFFQVSRIACGDGMYKDEQIAPLFFRAPANVWLPGKWRLLIGTLERARLIVYGPHDVLEIGDVMQCLSDKTAHWGGKFELVTDHVSRVGSAAEQWMRDQQLPTTPFVAHHSLFGEQAADMLRKQLAWYATHLIAFSDGNDKATLDMIEVAKNQGLRVGVMKCATQSTSLHMLA